MIPGPFHQAFVDQPNVLVVNQLQCRSNVEYVEFFDQRADLQCSDLRRRALIYEIVVELLQGDVGKGNGFVVDRIVTQARNSCNYFGGY